MAIELIALCEMRIVRGPRFDLGVTPFGRRVVAEVADATLTGERVNARLAGVAGADWATTAEDGLTTVDARLTLRTDDDAHLLVTYTGRIPDLRSYPNCPVYTAPTFYTGDERYRWLADIQAIAKGVFDGPQELVYDIYEVR